MHMDNCKDMVLDKEIKKKHYELFLELVDIYAYYTQQDHIKYRELKDKCKSVLEEKSRPTIEVDIDSVNFLNRLVDNGYRLKWNGVLQFGDITMLIDEDTNEEEPYYFIGYNINYHNNTLTLKISNKKSSRNNTKTINQYLKEVKKTQALLMSNRYLFNKTKNNELNMDDRNIQ